MQVRAGMPRQDRFEWCLEDGTLDLWPQAFSGPEADDLLDALRREIDWRTEEIVLFGQRRLVPRLVAWHGVPGACYTYSGVRHDPQPFTASLAAIRRRIGGISHATFDSVLLNRYRDGRDGMGWHSDDEPELGRNPVIASVSLGATRRFSLRHRRSGRRVDVELPHGSLLLMSGSLQHHWQHALPKTRRPCGERVNLTWRNVAARAGVASDPAPCT